MSDLPTNTGRTEHWEIRHPGTGERVKCASFDETLQWYEGYNIPLRFVDGVPESFEESYERMRVYHGILPNGVPPIFQPPTTK